jgi:hypothetical protein
VETRRCFWIFELVVYRLFPWSKYEDEDEDGAYEYVEACVLSAEVADGV